jgi:hypothetical protein
LGIFFNGCQRGYLYLRYWTITLLKEIHIKAVLAFAARREEITKVIALA